MNKHKNKLPVIAGIMFMMVAVIAVSSAWLSGIHTYDLRLSFSSYVGLRHSTSILYFVSALIMLPMLGYYIAGTKIPTVKTIVYAIVFICVLGTALFPCNKYSDSPSLTTINLHNCFSVGGILPVTASFILSAVLSKNKKQKITAVLSLLYAAVFIVLFVLHFEPLFQTFFIWESLFIVLLLTELYMEQYGKNSNSSIK